MCITTVQDSGRAPDFLTRRPIQSRSQQILLARQIRAWQEHPDGPESAPKALQRQGQRAQKALVEGNMGLVLKMARSFSGRGVDYDDLVQAGAIGLMTAARKFDPARGHAFSTYAVWWIRQALQRESRRSSTIALPLHTSELAFRAMATASRLEGEQGRAPTLQEVSDALQGRYSAKQLAAALAALDRSRVRSLNSRPRDVDNGSELMDLVAAGDDNASWDELAERDEQERVLTCLQQLDPQTARAMVEVHAKGRTLRAVALEDGVSRETVRQRIRQGSLEIRHRLAAGPIPCGHSRNGRADGRIEAAGTAA